jgi:tRNA 2-thiouridine synthesizing protein A
MKQTLDTSRLQCPVPLLMAKRQLRSMQPEDVLVVIATDPDAPVDFGAWAAVERHLLTQRRLGGEKLELTVVKGLAR